MVLCSWTSVLFHPKEVDNTTKHMHAAVRPMPASARWGLYCARGSLVDSLEPGRVWVCIVGAQEVLTESKAVAKHRETGALLPGLEMSSAVLAVGFGRQRAACVTAEGRVRMQDPGKRSGLPIQVWGSPSHETELLPRQEGEERGVWRAQD